VLLLIDLLSDCNNIYDTRGTKSKEGIRMCRRGDCIIRIILVNDALFDYSTKQGVVEGKKRKEFKTKTARMRDDHGGSMHSLLVCRYE
jgi:hypothetical protein